ncbi:hypothetical protein [Lentilactobacillus laojiaonis]|uniref:hypothetical protein n=1 Tax=Lentilactobacillus laojiaonis TaxID=2883998 RepID=UPI001D09E8A3|nr:hypothetical protein [Lentilactobacillus laojiaonis]UDM31782.1 hypothetical protein LHL71_04340 [Lentilactobacillus laojiaonis]
MKKKLKIFILVSIPSIIVLITIVGLGIYKFNKQQSESKIKFTSTSKYVYSKNIDFINGTKVGKTEDSKHYAYKDGYNGDNLSLPLEGFNHDWARGYQSVVNPSYKKGQLTGGKVKGTRDGKKAASQNTVTGEVGEDWKDSNNLYERTYYKYFIYYFKENGGSNKLLKEIFSKNHTTYVNF